MNTKRHKIEQNTWYYERTHIESKTKYGFPIFLSMM